MKFDVTSNQKTIVENLIEDLELSSEAELLELAMTLLVWANKEVKNGNKIASFNPETKDVSLVQISKIEKTMKDI